MIVKHEFRKVGVSMTDYLADVYEPLACLCERLADVDAPWLVGGSTGCLLQDVDLDCKPKDLDLYADHFYVDQLENSLRSWKTDAAHYSETARYRSYLSRFRIGSFEMELVANLSVNTTGGQYLVEVTDVLYPFAKTVTVQNNKVAVMPLEHEFVFNLLRDRQDRFEPIASAIQRRGIDETLWQKLKQRNSFTDTFWHRAGELIGLLDKGGDD